MQKMYQYSVSVSAFMNSNVGKKSRLTLDLVCIRRLSLLFSSLVARAVSV